MRALLSFALLMTTVSSALADDSDTSELAKKLSNPISDLISAPFQVNYDCCFGPDDGNRVTLNVQPVIPFEMDKDWTLIVRTIVPVIDQEETAVGLGDHFGLGDTIQSFFLSPTPAPGGWILGVGPAFLWPTATDNTIGSRKWGAGPTAVLLKQESGWTYGVLANHIWSYAGESDRASVSNTFLQPFVSYTWPDTTSLALNTESTYNWEAEQWTVPLNLMVSHIFRIGTQATSFQFGLRYYATAPEETATWGARFSVVFLFPQQR